ncbi:hypothetical protein ACHWQZ_G003013 [Mnemiopsis leidyi]
MWRTVAILLFVVVCINTVLTEAGTGECILSDSRIEKVSKRFKNRCLKKGYESYIAGCASEGDPENL